MSKIGPKMSEKWSKYYQSPTDKQCSKLFKIGLKCQIKIPILAQKNKIGKKLTKIGQNIINKPF